MAIGRVAISHELSFGLQEHSKSPHPDQSSEGFRVLWSSSEEQQNRSLAVSATLSPIRQHDVNESVLLSKGRKCRQLSDVPLFMLNHHCGM